MSTCPHWDCPERNEMGYCRHTACINPTYNTKLIYSDHTITNEEALKMISECGLNIEYPLHTLVFAKVLAAMERQIPKDPIEQSYFYGRYYLCPNCKQPLIEGKACCNNECAQRINWD